MRVGIFGGTFNPPHNGHLSAACAFIKAAALDRLLVIPAFLPPHKTVEGVSSEQRLEMAKIAFSEMKNVTVSDMEIRRGGISYTADTLKELSKNGDSLFLLCGSDMFLSLDTWYQPQSVFSLATVCPVCRDFDSQIATEMSNKEKEYMQRFNAQILRIENSSTIDVSSSAIRSCVKNNIDVKDLLPTVVLAYIRNEGLYL